MGTNALYEEMLAEGFNVEGVTHVFNYNLPDEPENYVHRIGRTGRAGNYGVAYTILTQKDKKRLETIETFIDMKIDRICLLEDSNKATQKAKSVKPSKHSTSLSQDNRRKSSVKQDTIQQNKKRKPFGKKFSNKKKNKYYKK